MIGAMNTSLNLVLSKDSQVVMKIVIPDDQRAQLLNGPHDVEIMKRGGIEAVNKIVDAVIGITVSTIAVLISSSTNRHTA